MGGSPGVRGARGRRADRAEDPRHAGGIPRAPRPIGPALGLCATLLAGCAEKAAPAALVAARLVEDDGGPSAVVLAFDRPIDPRIREVAPDAVAVRPAGTIEIGRIARAGPRELRLELRRAEGLQPRGIFDPARPEAGPTGIALRAPWVADPGAFVDLAPPARHPRLLEAHWRDANGNRVVDRGDRVVLSFDRPVRLADPGKARDLELVPEHAVLPVTGDRLDVGAPATPARGRRRAFLSESPDPRTIRIILGTSPRLTIGGIFDPGRLGVGAPSGIALNASPVAPSRVIAHADPGAAGAISRGIVDIGPDPSFVPLATACARFPHAAGLEQHAVVALRDRLIIVGGIDPGVPLDESRTAEVLAFIPGRGLRSIGSLPEVRRRHAAVLLPGPIRLANRPAILVLGGIGPSGCVGAIDLVAPFSKAPIRRTGVSLLVPRHDHAAVAVPGPPDGDGTVRSGEVWVIGGRDATGRILSLAEVIPYRWEEGAAEPAIGKPEPFRYLPYARTEHTATRVRAAGRDMIFLFGGLCRPSRDASATPLPSWSSVLIDPAARRAGAPPFSVARDLTDSIDPEILPLLPRRGHRAVWLEARGEVLIAGGTAAGHDEPAPTLARPEFAIVWKAGIPGEFRTAGDLAEPRTRHALVALPDGRALVIGGAGLHGQPLASIEVYLPERDGFLPFCAPLPGPRAGAEAARIETPEGPRVYVAGGAEGHAVIAIDPGRIP